MHPFRVMRDEGGAVLVFVAVALVVLVGMAALAIDVGRLFVARQRAQNVCDAAALAGARYLTGDEDCTLSTARPSQEAMNCISMNNEDTPSWLLQGPAITFPTEVTYVNNPDGDNSVTVNPGEAITVSGAVNVEFGFAGIFGFDSRLVTASATALLAPGQAYYGNLIIPIVVSDQAFIDPIERGEPQEFGTVDDWDQGFLGPGNWLSVRFDGDQGESIYIDRLRGVEESGDELDPVSVAVGDFLFSEPGGASGEGSGSKTYEGLIGTFTGNGTLKDAGRILLETDPRFQATDIYTGYNPNAWQNWVDAEDTATGMFPYTQRIVILPIIRDSEDLVTGASTPVEVVGFAAFWIERVWDGETERAPGDIPLKGDIDGYFIQAILGEDVDDGSWVFPSPDDSSGYEDDNFKVVRLIS